MTPSRTTVAPPDGIPLAYVAPEATKRINDIQRIADMLYPDPPTGDPFWIASARSLFLGIALYLFETPSRPKTVGEVLRQGMACDDEGFGSSLEAPDRRPQSHGESTVRRSACAPSTR